jgi:hypothetical protein
MNDDEFVAGTERDLDPTLQHVRIGDDGFAVKPLGLSARSPSISPDGSLWAYLVEDPESGDMRLVVWNAKTEKEIGRWSPPSPASLTPLSDTAWADSTHLAVTAEVDGDAQLNVVDVSELVDR